MSEIIIKEQQPDEQTEQVLAQSNNTNSASDNAKEALKYAATAATMQDQQFVDQLQSTIKESVLYGAKVEKNIEEVVNQGKLLDSHTSRATAYYNKHYAILEFGGIDKACSMSVMRLTLMLMVVPYFLTAILIKTPLRILSILFSEFNKLLLTIAEFGKPARLLCQCIIWTSIAVGMVVLLIMGIQYIFYNV